MWTKHGKCSVDPPNLWILMLIVTSAYSVGMVNCLRCWHCIANNCDTDPSSHPHASKEHCHLGWYCQKVYREVMSVHEKKTYISTVRSCARDCTPRNDFINCSQTRLENRGCSWRVCCRDKDLCNAARPNTILAADHVTAMAPFLYVLPTVWFNL